MNGTSGHGAIDILAPEGTPVVAVADGKLENVGWNTLGGNRLHVITDAGDDFYYAHLKRYANGLKSGDTVRAGQVIGYVGKTGQSGDVFHLHFAWKPAGMSSYSNPFSFLNKLWDALTKPSTTVRSAKTYLA